VKTIISILMISNIFLGAIAQNDTIVPTRQIAYTPEYEFEDGLYLSFYQFKNNTPYPRTNIVTGIDFNDPDFYSKVLANNTISIYYIDGSKQELQVEKIWGYSKNKGIYINMNGEFTRIPMLGTISHFTSNKTVYQNFNDPFMYNHYNVMHTPTTIGTEMQQYILDFETGKVYEYEIESLEIILMRDSVLYDEFNLLKRKKKEQQKFVFLRKYNQKHPLMFPER